LVIRGNSETSVFPVEHIKNVRLIAPKTPERMGLFGRARMLISVGAAPDPDQLADPDVPLNCPG